MSKLWKLLQHPNLVYVHLATPCGTFSRARDKPISEELKQKGVKEPQPLRSDKHVWGLPEVGEPVWGWLDDEWWPFKNPEATRVENGNKLAFATAYIAYWCDAHGIYFSIENPTNSYLWQIPQMQQLTSRPGVFDVVL